MSTRNRLERLLRVRRAERDRARIDAGIAARAAAQAERERDDRQLELAAAARSLGDQSVIGLLREQWRAGVAGIRQLGAATERAGDDYEAAQASGAAAREDLLAARRRLRGAERLNEKAEEALRRKALRAAQRRLDELAQQRRPRVPTRFGAVLFLALLVVGVRTTAAETTADAPQTPGVALLLGEIRVREAYLDTRERELADREQHVIALETTIRERLDELEEITTAVEQRIANWEKAHQDKSLSRLAKIYGTMEPRTAASLLEGLELDLATRIIAKMKHKQSAALLPLISQPRALAMSRSVAHPLGNPPLAGKDRP